jgi:succinate dehydrogenase / fumarate reductase flavoprotein subunit
MASTKSAIRSDSNRVRRVIVVGGGLAGLMTVIKLCEAGVPVDLFSLVPVKRSHSACAQGGINASVDTKGEGDSPQIHLEETVYGGDFLANQPPIKAMCDAAPSIVYMLDRMGVPFNRTAEGLLDFRRFGGTLFHRTAFAGATTGQQLLYALDEQVRRWETVDIENEKGERVRGRWCASSSGGIFWGSSGTTRGSAGASSPRTSRRWRSSPFPATRCASRRAAAASSSGDRPTA